MVDSLTGASVRLVVILDVILSFDIYIHCHSNKCLTRMMSGFVKVFDGV